MDNFFDSLREATTFSILNTKTRILAGEDLPWQSRHDSIFVSSRSFSSDWNDSRIGNTLKTFEQEMDDFFTNFGEKFSLVHLE